MQGALRQTDVMLPRVSPRRGASIRTVAVSPPISLKSVRPRRRVSGASVGSAETKIPVRLGELGSHCDK
jgi:hypothetical protein